MSRATNDWKTLRHAGKLLAGEAKVWWESNVNHSGPNKGKLDPGFDADWHADLTTTAKKLFAMARRIRGK